MTVSESEPLIRHHKLLQSYYASLESRVGYRFILGGTRHFGYYDSDTWWPFPIGTALRKMEDRLFETLNLPPGSTVLDAGCGYGHVAMRMAQGGLKVRAIDIVDRHIAHARSNAAAAGLEKAITVQKADFHHLDDFRSESLDGVYAMETTVHATDARKVLNEYFRVLKPGGSIALFEYEHSVPPNAPEEMVKMFGQVNKYAAMPANIEFEEGTFPALLEEIGFQDIEVSDLSENVKPMLRLFFVLAYIPYLIIRCFGLEARFINCVAAIVAYRYFSFHRYAAVRASKPTSGNTSPVEPKKVQ
ncbi:hypothetical protein N7474_004751 [Penicillium riverlandense]|uniref:uncharacterized protein n=1 Tax=Penicillium riverlandense TaxID=1903569 RepID=UPI00254979C7|nr:uncharacterized protein N7474_004751 [Penicillium riverlandense]KAJ5819160.1 hypothetical protein N7474_004751 [Penicillium riverlandense]